tara:strand:+ start:1432 stop:1611 length:180 start_codon:yes stop_codon:yes gene_type:complete
VRLFLLLFLLLGLSGPAFANMDNDRITQDPGIMGGERQTIEFPLPSPNMLTQLACDDCN